MSYQDDEARYEANKDAYQGNEAYNAAHPHILSTNILVRDFLAFVLGNGGVSAWQNVPKGFDISAEGWQQMEARIEDAIATNDVTRAKQLAMEYEQRASAYLSKWRQIIANPRARQAGQ